MSIPLLGRVENMEIARTTDANSSEVVRGNDSRLTNARTPLAHGTHVPAGGSAGQVLTKNSATDGDAGWSSPSGGGSLVTAQAGMGATFASGTQTFAVGAMAVGEFKFCTGTWSKTSTSVSGTVNITLPASGTYQFMIVLNHSNGSKYQGAQVSGGFTMFTYTNTTAFAGDFAIWVRRIS